MAATVSLEAWLFSFLCGSPELAALIGTRIYENIAPQNATYPAVVYTIITGGGDYTMSDATNQRTNLVQVSAWATSGTSRRAVADAVESRLSGLRGEHNGKAIQSVFLENETDVFELSPGNESLRLFGRHMDFEITHEINAQTRLTE